MVHESGADGFSQTSHSFVFHLMIRGVRCIVGFMGDIKMLVFWSETGIKAEALWYGSHQCGFHSELIVIHSLLHIILTRFYSLLSYYSSINTDVKPCLWFASTTMLGHTRHGPLDFLQQAGINVEDWPSVSPNLNTNGHTCDDLGRRMCQHQETLMNCLQLWV